MGNGTLSPAELPAIQSFLEFQGISKCNKAASAATSDPVGSYAWNNSQLQNGVRGLQGVITSADPASTAINTRLAQRRKMLKPHSSYPMQDPVLPIDRLHPNARPTPFSP
jgi:hypothetical protein